MAIAAELSSPTGPPTTQVVNALDCGNGRGIAGVATTMMTREQTLALGLALALSPMAAATMAIARRPLPKRWRIAGPNRTLRHESSDDSAEGEDHWQQQREDPTTATLKCQL